MNSRSFVGVVGASFSRGAAGRWSVLGALVLGAVACGGTSTDDASEGASNALSRPAALSAAALAAGDYVLDNQDVGATLTISAVAASTVSYSLGVLGKAGSRHNGELDARVARVSGASFVDAVDADCKISLQSAGEGAVKLQQTGPCSDAGFGAFLDGSGTYTKKTAAPVANGGWTGLYENETTHRAWAIRITSENPLTFRIFAGSLDDDAETVDAKGLVATTSGSTVSFTKGSDCAIKLAKLDFGVTVTQTGSCASIGFPASNDLSMSDDQGADFSRIDEGKECFDTKELAVRVGTCPSPL